MWRLSPASEASPGQTYHLLVGVEYVVGRKNCAVLIQNDQSISRSHAILSVCHPEVNLNQSSTLPVLTLKDTSKYGTFVNEEQIPNGTTRILKSGDRVSFGVFESKYKVEYEPLIACSSCLNASQKSDLNKNILQLGGHAVNEWKEDCTHLVMVSVKVTVKTICALICGRPVVKPEYFAELIKAIQGKQQLPKAASFCPEIDEPSINHEKIDLSACPQRKTIFKEKMFVFLTAKQYAKLSPAIKLGGGEAKLMSEETGDAASLVAADVCVIEAGLANSQASISELERKWVDTVSAVLQRNKYRTISEAEISLAVIFASTEKYCNPQNQLNMVSVVPGASLSQCAAVDETIMATITGNISAYVPDTKKDEQMDTCMEIIDENSNEGTATKERKIHPDNITTVKETPAESGIVNKMTTLSRWNRKSENEQSLSFSPSKTTGDSRNRERDSQPELNSIKNYFQTACKKRERSVDGETSQSKHAKTEESPHGCSQTQPVTSSFWNNNVGGSQKQSYTLDQKASQSGKSMEESSKLEKIIGKSNLAGNSTSKRKKELDDSVEDEESLELVFASGELDWENDIGYDEQSAQGAKKKKKLEAEQGNSGNRKPGKVLLEKKQSMPSLNPKQEIKEQPDSPRNDINDPGELGSHCSHLPSRLLMSEFRSLVVSQPRSGSCTEKTDYSHLNNFKKFKKVAYPGVGELPRIIGGSDLIAHHARKNAEMEEWLQQEIEEQNRYAKEESLADDLFRYNPHTKRR